MAIKKTRIPLDFHIDSRTNDLTKDAKLVNCFVDTTPEGKDIVKRPGTVLYTPGGTAIPSGTGQGIYSFQQNVISAVISGGAGTIYKTSVANQSAVPPSSSGTTWNTPQTITVQAPGNLTDLTVAINSPLSYGGLYHCNIVSAFNKLWVASPNYLYSSSDGGISWQSIANPLTAVPYSSGGQNIYAVGARLVYFNSKLWIFGGTYLFFSFGANFVNNPYTYSSVDGSTWVQASTSFTPGGANGRAGFATIEKSGTIYLLGGHTVSNTIASVYKTTDMINWTLVTAAGPSGHVFGSFLSGTTLYTYASAVTTPGSSSISAAILQKSTDNGATWTTVSTPISNNTFNNQSLVLLGTTLYQYSNANTLNGSTYTGSLQKSTDLGITWTAVSPGITPGGIGYLKASPDGNSLQIFSGSTGVVLYTATTDIPGVPAGVSNTTTAGGTSGTSGVLSFSQTSQVPYLFYHNSSTMWTYNGTTGVTAAVTSAGAPTSQGMTLVPGAVYLDDTTYVMTTTGRIYNSAIEDPTTWNALDYVSKASEPDRGVAIEKILNYLVAFGEWSMEFFYDAANPTGSPLARNDSAKQEIGCANGYTVVHGHSSVFWVGQQRTAGRGVYMLQGLSPKKISTNAIDKYLNADAMTNPRAFFLTIQGHPMYVLTLKDSALTFVYDLTENHWYQWTSDNGSGTETMFDGHFHCEVNGIDYLQNETTGALYKLQVTTYQDNGKNITFKAVSPRIDGGTVNKKFCYSLELVGNNTAAVISERHSDDDYTTWSTARTLDMSVGRPIQRSYGSFRRRATELSSTSNAPIRLKAMELQIEEGTN